MRRVLAMAAGVLRVVSTILRVGTEPSLDRAIALVPGLDAQRTLAFGTNARVLHVNDFPHPETIAFIGNAIPV